ncbi:MAG: tRNA (5-methylaminomethyl-2-thiouridine)(34)-methyltransferase MnmD, partial [Bdellovibrionales bacterium]|nr:tRNA (5-methylaminomethyl-2-thiouridine)(34)-methyltransferase MnmD [Bdellovibrionales bacterium]
MYSLNHPELDWKGSSHPYSTTFTDIYYPIEGALQQSRDVFIGGNTIPERLQRRSNQADNSPLVIGELGFGAGVNFLATLQEWSQLQSPKHPLHYISVENAPLHPVDLKRALSAFPELSSFSEELLAQYPPPLRGAHRLHFARNQVTLDLLFQDALEAFESQSFTADAWYLDGFDPRRNDSLWNEKLFKIVRA